MSDTVNFTINGQAMAVAKGTTVMQAAKSAGVSIPHFCWHEGLSIAGVCRFCMVEVEGRPKLEIACNLQATEGMVVNTVSTKVTDAHKWALEFHLVNHPLDCPVCDQAGECGLQDYYMDVGKYESQMTQAKVLKPKAIDLGERLILDTERCILCSRCVRFEEEVTKTGALGIFDRGDRAIIGTYDEEKIQHNYQENLVDICPVGAFTSKPFRFKQRVWFLKEKSSICPGCSTGCHIKLHAKPQMKRYYRVKPEHAPEANGHWMCDKGRDVIHHLNPEERLTEAFTAQGAEYLSSPIDNALGTLAQKLKQTDPKKIALLVSPQYTCEEYDGILDLLVNKLHVKNIFAWRESTESVSDFDGILWRGDHNPNTAGLNQSLGKHHVKALPLKNQVDECLASQPEVIIALAPEVLKTFPSYQKDLGKLNQGKWVSLWSSQYASRDVTGLHQLIPLKAFAEKTGTFLNHREQKGHLTEPFEPVVSGLGDVAEVCHQLSQKLFHV